MNKGNNNIDEIFKQSFENARMKAPSSAFNAVQSKLGSQVAHTSIVSSSFSTIKIAAIAIGVVGAAAGVYFGFGDENKTDNEAKEISFDSKTDNTRLDSTSKVEFVQSGEMNSQRNAKVESVATRSGSEFQVSNKLQDFNDFKLIEGNVIGPPPKENETLDRPVIGLGNQNLQTEEFTNENYKLNNLSSIEALSRNQVNSIQNLKCKGLFDVDLDHPIEGPQELAIGIKGELALYEWGTGDMCISRMKGKDFTWNGPIYVKKSQEMRFWVRALFMDGCRDTFEFVRWVVPTNYSGNEVFPNVFTPNGDGFNDSFYVDIPRPEWFEIRVIDARGNEVFSSKDNNVKWSGYTGQVKCPKGIYQVQMRRKYMDDLQIETKNFSIELR